MPIKAWVPRPSDSTKPTESLSFAEIQAEFGGSDGIGLNEYYRGGAYVPSDAVGYPNGVATAIPTTGAISVANFYGSSKYQLYTYNLASDGVATGLNLFNAASAAGLNNNVTASRWYITVNNAGILGASDVFNYAIDTGSGYARTPIIVINNSGYILGAGGRGTDYIAWYQAADGYWDSYYYWRGGNCMRFRQGEIYINNSGYIAAGGGSGGIGTNNIHGGGSGYVYAPGYRTYLANSGDPSGSLLSGGGFQDDGGSSGNPNGGAGGGWVLRSGANESLSTDGWGYGVQGTNNYVFHGGGSPGCVIVYDVGWTTTSLGFVRGDYCTSDGLPYLSPQGPVRPPPPPPTGDGGGGDAGGDAGGGDGY